MISVDKRKLITSEESFLTRAPITPRDVRRRYSKGRDLDVVLRNGYRKSGIWAGKMAGTVRTSCSPGWIGFKKLTGEEQAARLVMRCYALEKSKSIANTI